MGLFLAQSGRRWGGSRRRCGSAEEKQNCYGRNMISNQSVFECWCSDSTPGISAPTCACFRFSLFAFPSSLFQTSSLHFIFCDVRGNRFSEGSDRGDCERVGGRCVSFKALTLFETQTLSFLATLVLVVVLETLVALQSRCWTEPIKK